MLARILGWLWIVCGVLFLLKPVWLRKRLRKKGWRKFRKYLFLLALILGIFLIKITCGAEGAVPKIIMVIGIILIIKSFFILKSKAAEGMIEWFSNKPLYVFRIGAAGYIFFGVLLVMMGR